MVSLVVVVVVVVVAVAGVSLGASSGVDDGAGGAVWLLVSPGFCRRHLFPPNVPRSAACS